jgi:hypothetical protein
MNRTQRMYRGDEEYMCLRELSQNFLKEESRCRRYEDSIKMDLKYIYGVLMWTEL